MKKKSIARLIVRIAIVIISAFLVLALAAWVYNTFPSPRQWLPTHSKPGELRLTANGTGAGMLSVSLILKDGSRYTLDTGSGVISGEPQHYPLPSDLPDDAALTVHITFNDHRLIHSEINALCFPIHERESDLKRHGLLMYLSDASGLSVYVISGRTKICYTYIEEVDDWIIWDNPSGISHFPSGMGAGPEPSSGWESNTWKYVPADNTTKDQQQ